MLHLTSLRALCGVTLAALALTLPAAAQSPNGYTIVDLGTMNGYTSVGNAINASGQVVGYTDSPANVRQAVLWTGATATYLNTPSGVDSAAYGINDSGQVTGATLFHVNYPYHYPLNAVRWTGGAITSLDTGGASDSVGYAINAGGQVVGSCGYGMNPTAFAAQWLGTTAVPLDHEAYRVSVGYGINTSGLVAGYVSDTSVSRAVVWTGTTPTYLPSLGGDYNIAYAINDNGQIAGVSNLTQTGHFHAVRWTGTTATDLGMLNGADTVGEGINASGDIVGYGGYAFTPARAFLYKGGGMIDLNTVLPMGSGWVLTDARAINDSGWITGQGTINGQPHAFLLKPDTAPVIGFIALEGVSDLSAVSPAAPLGVFHIGFRTPGTTAEVFRADVTLTPISGSNRATFTLPAVPNGTYDVTLQGGKNLRVLLPQQFISQIGYLPPVTLPAGDANNDNSVDTTDFGLLVGSYGSDSSIPGSGYDATCDFNFDGVVDTADFALLVGNYNASGDN